MRGRFVLGLSILVMSCTVESGGEQSPLFQGSGVLIADDGSGRTVSVDAAGVPIVSSCEAGQIVVRGASGWECRFPDSSLEADPSVNDLGKETLSCGSGDVASFDGTSWVCTARITEAEVDAFVTNNGFATTTNLAAVDTRVATLEGQSLDARLEALELLVTQQDAQITALETLVDAFFPVLFTDDFSGSGDPAGTDFPSTSVWADLPGGGTPTPFNLNGGYLLLDSTSASDYCMKAKQASSAFVGGPAAPRLRFSAVLRIPVAGMNRLTIAGNRNSAATCSEDRGLGVTLQIDFAGNDSVRGPDGTGAAFVTYGALSADFVDNVEYFVEARFGSSTAVSICTNNYCGESGATPFFSHDGPGASAAGAWDDFVISVRNETTNLIRVNEVRFDVPKP